MMNWPARLSLIALLTIGLSATPACAAQPEPREPALPALQANGQQVAIAGRVLVVELSGELREKPAGFSIWQLLGQPDAPALSRLLTRLRDAAVDPDIDGVLLQMRAFDLSLAQSEELGSLVRQIRQQGKRVVAYAPDYDTATYLLATHADTIVMPQQGEVELPGVEMSMIFLKGLLDKVNVQADLIQIGRFKGAGEPFTRTQASPELLQQINAIADSRYNQIVSTIATNRGMDPKQVQAAINEAWLTGQRAQALGLVDQLMSPSEFARWFAKEIAGARGDLAEQPRQNDAPEEQLQEFQIDQPQAQRPFDWTEVLRRMLRTDPAAREDQPAIAVIYALGAILPDQPGLAGGDMVTPQRIREALQTALRDEQVRAIVVRIDSPGGSASASDEIWQALREADRVKPVTVSLGAQAASGGYYIAAAGRSISADQATITGSIGVVGGKVILNEVLDAIGINVQPVRRGERAGMFSLLEPFTEAERQFVQTKMNETYELFKQRVQTTRGQRIPDIDAVAQGRLFVGPAAVQAGLVDRIATLDQVVRDAAKTAGIEEDHRIIVLPEPRTLTDLLRGAGDAEARLPAGVTAALHALPPAYSRELSQLWQMVQILQRERVMTALPLGIVETETRR